MQHNVTQQLSNKKIPGKPWLMEQTQDPELAGYATKLLALDSRVPAL